MVNKILDLLQCVKCHTALDFIASSSTLKCIQCSTEYPIINGVPSFSYNSIDDDLTAKAFSNQWALYKNGEYESTEVFGLKEEDYLNHFCYAFKIDKIEELTGIILEVGVGSGHLINILASKAPNATIIGMDISDNIFALSPLMSKYKNLFLIQGDLLTPPLKASSINYLYSSGVLHHTKSLYDSIKSLWILLEECSGKFYFWVYPSYQFCAYDKLRQLLGKPYLYSEKTRYRLSKLLAPFLWIYFLITKKYSYKDHLESLATIQFRIFDNISPEFQHRASKQDIYDWCAQLEIKDYAIVNDLGVLCHKRKKNV